MFIVTEYAALSYGLKIYDFPINQTVGSSYERVQDVIVFKGPPALIEKPDAILASTK